MSLPDHFHRCLNRFRRDLQSIAINQVIDFLDKNKNQLDKGELKLFNDRGMCGSAKINELLNRLAERDELFFFDFLEALEKANHSDLAWKMRLHLRNGKTREKSDDRDPVQEIRQRLDNRGPEKVPDFRSCKSQADFRLKQSLPGVETPEPGVRVCKSEADFRPAWSRSPVSADGEEDDVVVDLDEERRKGRQGSRAPSTPMRRSAEVPSRDSGYTSVLTSARSTSIASRAISTAASSARVYHLDHRDMEELVRQVKEALESSSAVQGGVSEESVRQIVAKEMESREASFRDEGGLTREDLRRIVAEELAKKDSGCAGCVIS